MNEPCTYCGEPDCPTRDECAEYSRRLAAHDAGSRRYYGLKERGLGMGDCGLEKLGESPGKHGFSDDLSIDCNS